MSQAKRMREKAGGPTAAAQRWQVVARLLAAVVGGYALANLLSLALVGLLPMTRADKVMTAILLGFVVQACAVLWAFAGRSAGRVWRVMAVWLVAAALLLYLQGIGS